MTPLFAEYKVHACSKYFRVEWPWHARLPLHPRRTLHIGIAEVNEIVVQRVAEPPQWQIGGRRNHTVDWSEDGHWQCNDMGHGGVIVVDGAPDSGDPAPLRDGSLVNVGYGLTFTLVEPLTTPLLWAELIAQQHQALEAIARMQPRRSRHERDAWWPLVHSYGTAVMFDWLLERCRSVEDAEVELAHLVAWHEPDWLREALVP